MARRNKLSPPNPSEVLDNVSDGAGAVFGLLDIIPNVASELGTAVRRVVGGIADGVRGVGALGGNLVDDLGQSVDGIVQGVAQPIDQTVAQGKRTLEEIK